MIESDQLTWSPVEIKGKILELLHKATNEKFPDYTEEALYWLARLHFALGGMYPETEDFRKFKQDVLREFESWPNESGLFGLVTDCFNRSGSHEREEYMLACRMRSVIQIFCDEIKDVELIIREPDRGAVEESDELLIRPKEFEKNIERPAWAPASHWWWTAHNKTHR